MKILISILLTSLLGYFCLAGHSEARSAGPPLSSLTVADLDDRPVSMNDYPTKLVVLLHEDRDASGQNQDFKTELGKLSEQRHDRLILVALADVSAYDFWPARRYVKAALRRLRDEGATVLCDWKGIFHKKFALRKGESSLFLVQKDQIELAHRGVMTPAEAAALLDQIDRLSR